jgi:hypothetical protein
MARRPRPLQLLALLALVLAVGAQFPKKEKVKAPAVKSDIKCAATLRRCAAAPLSRGCAGTSAAACARSWPRTWRGS